MKSEFDSKDDEDYKSSLVVKSVTAQSIKNFVKQSYTDIFSEAVTLLRDIIYIETQFNIKFSQSFMKNSNDKRSVFPQMINDEKMAEYLELKINYQKILRKLLHIRSGFTKKLLIDISSTIYTLQDVAPCESESCGVIQSKSRSIKRTANSKNK